MSRMEDIFRYRDGNVRVWGHERRVCAVCGGLPLSPTDGPNGEVLRRVCGACTEPPESASTATEAKRDGYCPVPDKCRTEGRCLGSRPCINEEAATKGQQHG